MKTDALRHLCGAYLHEDWSYDYDGDWTGAAREFALEPDAHEIRQEVDAILAAGVSEDALRAVVVDVLRPSLLVEVVAPSYEALLQKVADTVDGELEKLARNKDT